MFLVFKFLIDVILFYYLVISNQTQGPILRKIKDLKVIKICELNVVSYIFLFDCPECQKQTLARLKCYTATTQPNGPNIYLKVDKVKQDYTIEFLINASGTG